MLVTTTTILFAVQFLISTGLLPASGEIYCVDPVPWCPEEPCRACHTLNYYAQNVSGYFASDTTFVFLPGIHYLNSTIAVSNVQNLALIGNESSTPGMLGLPAPSSQIHCQGAVGLIFTSIRGLTVRELLFSGCGAIINEGLMLQAALTVGYTGNGSAFDVSISGIMIQNSAGYGILGTNVLGQSTITDSTFQFNEGGHGYYGGNALFIYQQCPQDSSNVSTTLEIASSKFLHGSDQHYDSQAVATGLTVSIKPNCSNVAISVTDVIAYGNKANGGGNIGFLYFSTDVSNSFNVSNSQLEDGYAGWTGGGLNIYIYVTKQSGPLISCDPQNGIYQHRLVTVTNTTFVNNRAWGIGGAIYVQQFTLRDTLSCVNAIVRFEDCQFVNNTVVSKTGTANAAYIKHVKNDYVLPEFDVVFCNCTFAESGSPLAEYENPSVLSLEFATKVVFIDCTFRDNSATALSAVSSNIIFQGDITFQNNTGTIGGAILLCDRSVLNLKPNTTLNFRSNHAHSVGGAIYTERPCVRHYYCFYQTDDDIDSIHINFENNTAEVAGTALYGGTASCPNFDQIFKINNSRHSPSVVSSDPIGVCLCEDNAPDCSSKESKLFVYPGEDFTVHAITVGERSGTVPGAIHAEIIENSNGTAIQPLQGTQSVNTYKNCATVHYTIYSNLHFVRLELTAENPTPTVAAAGNFTPPLLYIELLDCPPGFSLSNASGNYRCDCVNVLKRHGIDCSIQNKSVHRPAAVWIGFNNSTRDNRGVLFHKYCPLYYCLSHDTDVDLSNPDEQCALGRSGILCGECKPGLSLVLGSSECVHCSNTYLVLLIPFGLAGLALVLLLIACNLTVSEGAINGLIFYANIIWINRPIFFPHGQVNIITVFIAWLNLDLGIQTCFYKGMDTFGKVWLQFAFPLYIWLILGFIVLLSRKSHRIAMLIGTNAVKVLATLFLLSFTKLQRAIIAALSFTLLTYPNNSSQYVWLYDASVDYIDKRHILLFAAGLAALIFFSFPYVLVLLFIQCMRKVSVHNRFLSWLIRLQPLFDAYTGPYKFKYQFWTGLLLFLRGILFLVFAFNYNIQPGLNLMAILLTSLLIFMLGWGLRGVYRKWPLDILESSFILNLGAVSAATFYTRQEGGNQNAVIHTSTGIASATFIGIVIYHLYKQISKTAFGRRLLLRVASFVHKRRRTPSQQSTSCSDTSSRGNEHSHLLHLVRSDAYREPVFDYLSNSLESSET